MSGGLDSATALFYALDRNYRCHCLIFDYGQRHRKEQQKAVEIASRAGVTFDIIKIQMPWKGSALLDRKVKVPQGRTIIPDDIPATYVPARNIIFLSFAASCAEARGAEAVFIGANALDYSGYPDCRPEFFEAYQAVLKTGLKAGVQGKAIKIHTPLLGKTKAQIIRLGKKLNVPYELTWSCYTGGRRPCGTCDSCLLRAKGFSEAGFSDPAAGRE